MQSEFWFGNNRAQRDVGETLARLLADGPAVLSVDAIARAAAVSYRTVHRALEVLAALGILSRQARRDSGLASGLIRSPSLLGFDGRAFAALKRAGRDAVREKLDAAWQRVALLRIRRMVCLHGRLSRSATMAVNNETLSISSLSSGADAERSALHALIGSRLLSPEQEKDAWNRLAALETVRP